ncbi:uncharacterized protein LOC112017369 [Quercus suber]|uniref:Uncharacterized protein n=1 Tax=Quercus suber TaxID=58331 RepID=A0AAW0LK34_QUESU|nr:uncharacterized protein LOC112017369 [Quercus suber]
MDSSATLSSRAQLVSRECDNTFPSPKYLSSQRTPSFSSSSSSSLSPCSSSFGSSNFADDSPLSPATPLRYSGVPFSWEHLPGIPKKKQASKKESSSKLLPLPPTSTTTPSSKKSNLEDVVGKKNCKQTFEKDPFFAALVECSKDDDQDQEPNKSIWNSAKVSRSLSDRFAFISLYTSCKRTSAISESIIYLPRSSRTSYDLI